MTNKNPALRPGVDLKKLTFIFLWVFAFGLVAHGFCYFNGNFSHDSLFSIYEESPDINIAVGRFLRPVYRMLRGNFALPVINGFLSLVYLSLAIYLLSDIMEIRRKSFLALTCGSPGMSMFWGQLLAHLPQAMQAVGFFSSGRNSTRMAALTVGLTRSSLNTASSAGMSSPLGQPSQQ